jgi:hypothetical protein
MKSAYELAQERLDQKHGKSAPLSDGQKKAIAEIDSRVRAKIAELEITFKPRAAEARTAGDGELAQKVEDNLRSEIARARSDGEEEKDRVRAG